MRDIVLAGTPTSCARRLSRELPHSSRFARATPRTGSGARVLILLAVAGCSSEVAGGRADGPAVFAEACARCHGESGTPSPSLVAQLGVKDLTVTPLTIERIEQQIRQGSDNKIMPAFAGVLKDDQIAAVAAYVLTLSK